jgi:hypothetical protein
MALRPSKLHQVCRETVNFLPAMRWRDAGGAAFRWVEHVNIQEMQALLAEVRCATVFHGGAGVRKVILIDSRVVVGAWSKGRSSSRRRNSCLRAALAWQVFGRLKVVVAWIPTGANPADDPSREEVLRKAIPLTTDQLTALIDLIEHPKFDMAGDNALPNDLHILDYINEMFVLPTIPPDSVDNLKKRIGSENMQVNTNDADNIKEIANKINDKPMHIDMNNLAVNYGNNSECNASNFVNKDKRWRDRCTPRNSAPRPRALLAPAALASVGRHPASLRAALQIRLSSNSRPAGPVLVLLVFASSGLAPATWPRRCRS